MNADDLYRLAPEDFTGARDAAAQQRKRDGDAAGAAELEALRRPSVAAWLVNRLAQDSPDLLASLLALGPELAQAQAGGDAAALRALGAQRRELVEAVTQTAVAASGRPVNAAVRLEVSATLGAALADPSSAEAVRSGRLVRSLSYAGFGAVDLTGAVAPTTSRAAPARTSDRSAGTRKDDEDDRRRRIAAAEAAAQEAAGRLDDAVRACEQADRSRAAAEQAGAALAEEVDRLAEEFARVREEHDRSEQAARRAGEFAQQARSAVAAAQDAADRARQDLDRLRRGT